MKKIILALLLCSTAVNATEFKFKWNFQGTILEIKKEEKNYKDAFEFAAVQCFKFFTKGLKYSEEYGIDVIDVCANPRK